MAIAAKISSDELTAQVTQRFDGATLEARLINAPGVTYIPGTTDDTTFLGLEVTVGTGGYARQSISYAAADVSVYSDDGVALTQRATVFTQDGSATPIEFSHVALVWTNGTSSGDILAVAQTSSAVVLGGGNQAAFYWNLKQFGYYSTSA
jgi:hypothetical protein